MDNKMSVVIVFVERSWRLMELPCLCLDTYRLLSWLLSWSQDVSRQYFHCLGLILVLETSVLVVHLLSWSHHLSLHVRPGSLREGLWIGAGFSKSYVLYIAQPTMSEHRRELKQLTTTSYAPASSFVDPPANCWRNGCHTVYISCFMPILRTILLMPTHVMAA